MRTGMTRIFMESYRAIHYLQGKEGAVVLGINNVGYLVRLVILKDRELNSDQDIRRKETETCPNVRPSNTRDNLAL